MGELFRMVNLRGVCVTPPRDAQPLLVRTHSTTWKDAVARAAADQPTTPVLLDAVRLWLEARLWRAPLAAVRREAAKHVPDVIDPSTTPRRQTLTDYLSSDAFAAEQAAAGDALIRIVQNPAAASADHAESVRGWLLVAHLLRGRALTPGEAEGKGEGDGGLGGGSADTGVGGIRSPRADVVSTMTGPSTPGWPSAGERAADAVALFAERAVLLIPADRVQPTTLTTALAPPPEPSASAPVPTGAPGPADELAATLAAAAALAHTAATSTYPALTAAAHAQINEVTKGEHLGGDFPFYRLADPIEVVIERLDERARRLVHEAWTTGEHVAGLPAPPRDPVVTDGAVEGSPAMTTSVRLGIGDLLLSKVVDSHYRYGDIAHVENVLAGEFRDRTHLRRRLTETEVSTETVNESVAEQENESTSRFELERETKSALKDEMRIEAGAQVSATYGPVHASADFGLTSTTTKETSNRQVSRFTQEVTTKSANRVRESTTERRRTLTSTEIVETAKHGFENRGAKAEHIIGIYRWVDRIDDIRTFNYGQRLMLGVTVPEPGAFLRWRAARADVALDPRPPDLEIGTGAHRRPLTPLDITPENYLTWAAITRTSTVKPPPARFATTGVAIAENKQGSTGAATQLFTMADTSVTVPDGYRLIRVRGTLSAVDDPIWASLSPGAKPPVGGLWVANKQVAYIDWSASPNKRHVPVPFNAPLGDVGPLEGSKSGAKIPIMLHGSNALGAFGAAVEFVFERTADALLTWQTETYGVLVDAHAAALAAWESRARDRMLGVLDYGDPPERKRQMERSDAEAAVHPDPGEHHRERCRRDGRRQCEPAGARPDPSRRPARARPPVRGRLRVGAHVLEVSGLPLREPGRLGDAVVPTRHRRRPPGVPLRRRCSGDHPRTTWDGDLGPVPHLVRHRMAGSQGAAARVRRRCRLRGGARDRTGETGRGPAGARCPLGREASHHAGDRAAGREPDHRPEPGPDTTAATDAGAHHANERAHHATLAQQHHCGPHTRAGWWTPQGSATANHPVTGATP